LLKKTIKIKDKCLFLLRQKNAEKYFTKLLTQPHICDKITVLKGRGALHEEYSTEKSRRGCGKKAWVPKRMPWRAS